MAYLIFNDAEGEFDRRELSGPVVIGRAADCDIAIRDIELSRRHCRIERLAERWVVSDLGSRNGTRVGGSRIERHVLSDGELIRVGRTRIYFCAGVFVPAPRGSRRQRRPEGRPVDPHEALAGTVCGVQLFDMEEDARLSGCPIPRPRPAEPAGYHREGVHAMVSQMASRSWDLTLTEEDDRAPQSPSLLSQVVPGKRSISREVAARREEIRRVGIRSDEAAPLGTIHILPPRPILRQASPARRGTIPRWLAKAYVVLACVVFGVALGVILSRTLTVPKPAPQPAGSRMADIDPRQLSTSGSVP